MLAIRHTVCSNHRQMYGLLGSKGILQHFDSVSQLGFFILVDGIDIAANFISQRFTTLSSLTMRRSISLPKVANWFSVAKKTFGRVGINFPSPKHHIHFKICKSNPVGLWKTFKSKRWRVAKT